MVLQSVIDSIRELGQQGIVFSCSAGRCFPVPVVDDARADSRLALNGTVVNYSCLDGFSLTDLSSTTAYCNGQQWSTPALHCQRKRVSLIAVWIYVNIAFLKMYTRFVQLDTTEVHFGHFLPWSSTCVRDLSRITNESVTLYY